MPSEQFSNLVQLFRAQRDAGALSAPEPPQWRQGYDLLGTMLPEVPDVTLTDVDLGGVPAVRFDPIDAKDGAILLFHGGGYVIGSRTSHGPFAASLANAANVPVLLVEYRLAPEHPWPAAHNDAEVAYRSVLEAGVPPERIALVGDSAGGGLVAGTLLRQRDAQRALPSCAVLLSPWVDMTGLGEVSAAAQDRDYLRPEALEAFAGHYVPDVAQRSNPECSPINADLAGLPPMLIEVGDAEILADQGRRFASAVKDAGGDVSLTDDPEMFHNWAMFAGAFPEADEAIARIASFVRSRLS